MEHLVPCSEEVHATHMAQVLTISKGPEKEHPDITFINALP
jgi:hypothetical protein